MEYSLSSSLVSNMGSLGPSPSLDLRFGERKTITAVKGATPTFTRSSSGTYIGDDGSVVTGTTNAFRIQRDASYVGSKLYVVSNGALSDNDFPLPNSILSFDGLDEFHYPLFSSPDYYIHFDTNSMSWFIGFIGNGSYVAFSEVDLNGEYVMDTGNGGTLSLSLTLAGKGLIIEESSSNLIGYSTAFTNAYWDKTAGVIASSAISLIALDGSGTAILVEDNNANSTHHIHDLVGNFTPTIGTKYCMSCYVRNNNQSCQYVQLAFWSGGFGANAYVNYDLDFTNVPLTVGSAITSSGIESVGNGWYRIWAVAPATSATLSGFQLCLIDSGVAARAGSYQGDGRGVYLWGAQVEAKLSPTSFIKTTTSSSAARSADLCDITGSNFTGIYNSTEFTLYAEASCPALVNNYIVGMDNGTSSEQAALISLSSGNFSSYVAAGGGTSAAINLSATAYSMTKLAASSKQNSFNFARNGTLGTADTSGNMPTLNNMKIGRGVGGNPVNGIIKSVRLYKTALPTTKIKSLTA